jgi:hypothetical protein
MITDGDVKGNPIEAIPNMIALSFANINLPVYSIIAFSAIPDSQHIEVISKNGIWFKIAAGPSVSRKA